MKIDNRNRSLYGQKSKGIPKKIVIHLIEALLLWMSYWILFQNEGEFPFSCSVFFAFYNAPELDEYLKEKYGKEYDEYAGKTKMLIPFIF